MIYAASWDGRLHQLNAADGEDIVPPAKFMPPNGKPYALSLLKNVIYTHTAQGCGGNPNMVYTYDLATHKVGSWGPAGGGMWGRSGPAISTKGDHVHGNGRRPLGPGERSLWQRHHRREAGSRNEEPGPVDYYGPSNAEWLFKRDLDMQVTPAIFDYKGKDTWWMPARSAVST